MAEALLGFLGGGNIIAPIEQLGNQLVVWLRKIFMSIWRYAVQIYRRVITYMMKDPVGFVTFMGELAVLLG